MSEADKLLRLQELDLELARIRNTAENLPQRSKVMAARAASKKIASEITKIVGQRKDLEIELNDLEVHKKFLSNKVSEVQGLEQTDFRSTKDIEYSLSSLAKKLEKVDFDSDKLMERLEVVEKAEKNARAMAKRLEDEESAQAESFKQATADLTARVKEIGAEREGLVSSISQASLDTYNACVKRFKGLAVEKLEGNRPTICRVALQPSSFSDIRKANSEIVTCPYCKRILVVSTDTEA